MHDILQYLKLNGEGLDSEIAAATGLSLAKVRGSVSALSAQGDVVVCRLTRYKNGAPINALLCRMSGYIPAAAPGRKIRPKS
jgi:DNA-binding IclR family transcriptional regulator